MSEFVAMQSDGHQSWLPADEAPTTLLLDMAFDLLVAAIAASGVFEGEAHRMCSQPTHTARLEGIAQLVVVREAD